MMSIVFNEDDVFQRVRVHPDPDAASSNSSRSGWKMYMSGQIIGIGTGLIFRQMKMTTPPSVSAVLQIVLMNRGHFRHGFIGMLTMIPPGTGHTGQ